MTIAVVRLIEYAGLWLPDCVKEPIKSFLSLRSANKGRDSGTCGTDGTVSSVWRRWLENMKEGDLMEGLDVHGTVLLRRNVICYIIICVKGHRIGTNGQL